MKRICLFAAYNYGDEIAEYVYDYLEELSKYADIYYLADNTINEDSSCIAKLLKICKNVYFVQHGKYDFGSYSELAKKYVGWEIILQYDELIFANDSCLCVQSFGQVFDKMDSIKCDAWGLLATDETNYNYQFTFEEYWRIPSLKVPLFTIGSYFIVFRKLVIEDLEFQNFINSVQKEQNRLIVCEKYEIGLTRFLKNKSYKIAMFDSIIYKNVVIYNEEGVKLLKRGFPLVKIKTFRENPLSVKNLGKLVHMIAVYAKSDLIYKYAEQLNLLKKHIIENKPNGDYKIFFNVARDTIGGGMLSINRFIERTIDLCENKNDHNVILSGLPLSEKPVNYSLFESKLPMVHFDVITKVSYPEKLMINIPEYYLPNFIESISDGQRDWLKKIPYLHINIMDQNHDYFPHRVYFEHCKSFTDKVTITTAHQEYSTQEIANDVGCPIKLLTPFLPEFYRIPHKQKEKIIAISPDEFEFDGVSRKNEALNYLRNILSDYNIVVINNISIEEYKQLISKAMFTITFGEGYDGYFIEPFLSDSVAFAVYNTTFFPQQFKHAPTVYGSYNEFMDRIVKDIRVLEKDGNLYDKYNKEIEKMIKQITNDEISLQNLKDFYNDKYDFVPEICLKTGYYKIIQGEKNGY